ncbi:membrane protein [Arthrobacter phage Sicarius2]|uniref:Membrane protein n=1 Tax=Arthrobacter phage Sicarius2 TaxID=2836090 RepID=A0A8F3INZ2_9CAUD|nr:membrane protein [Arthrobacter phage Sicarius2]
MAKQPPLKLTRRGVIVVGALNGVGIALGIISIFALAIMFGGQR